MFGMFGKKNSSGFSDEDIRQIQEAFSTFDVILESGLIGEILTRVEKLIKVCAKDIKPFLEEYSEYSTEETIKTIKAYSEKLEIPIELAASIYIAKAQRDTKILQDFISSAKIKL